MRCKLFMWIIIMLYRYKNVVTRSSSILYFSMRSPISTRFPNTCRYVTTSKATNCL